MPTNAMIISNIVFTPQTRIRMTFLMMSAPMRVITVPAISIVPPFRARPEDAHVLRVDQIKREPKTTAEGRGSSR